MPTCSVPYCVNATNKDSRLTFHEFPHETPLFLNKWVENIGRPNWRPGLRSVVCSEHFQKDDFDRQGRLRIGSFPSRFPDSPFRKKKKVIANVDVNLKGSGSPPKFRTILPAGQGSSANSTVKPIVNIFHCINNSTSSISTTPPVLKFNSNTQPLLSVKQNLPLKKQIANNIRQDGDSSDANTFVKIGWNAPLSSEKKKPDGTSETIVSLKSVENIKTKDDVHQRLTNSGTEPCVGSTYTLLSCRICGGTNQSNIDIFGAEGKKQNLAGLIKKCLPIEVSESETLPHFICKTCIFRLRACGDLIATCQKTNNILTGKDSCPDQNLDADPPVIHSRCGKNVQPGQESRRILFLEMTLKEGISVKNMITQAVQELTLRLIPKESRESRPQGRIMFLDLQGGNDAFPEQLKKAISMLFPSNKQMKAMEAKTNQETPSPSVNGKSTVQSKTTVQSSPPPLIMKPVSMKTASGNPSQNLLGQSTPVLSAAPVTVLPDTLSSPSPLCISALPHLLPPNAHSLATTLVPQFSVNQILNLPSQSKCNLIKVHPQPNVIHVQQNNSNVEKSIGELHSSVFENQTAPADALPLSGMKDISVPPLVPLSEPPPLTSIQSMTNNSLPTLDINKLKDKVFTKINNMGNQFKLGDKIVGIVVRNNDSSEEIQRKLQVKFSKQSTTTSDKSKERMILPKDSSVMSAEDVNALDPSGIGEEMKKLREKPMDICPASENPSRYFNRKNTRKLNLSYMWRKSSFLVNSYQKLFTWQIPDDDAADPEPMLTCRVCKFSAKDKGEVENHLQAHPDLQCPKCSKYFLTVAKVHEHINVIHRIVSPTDIKRKPQISWRPNPLKRPPLKQFQCSRCDKRFKMREALKRHCVTCKERTLAEKVVAITKAIMLTCPICNRSFSCQPTLQDHMLTHTKRTSWLCDICGTVLKSASNYRSHIARHDENAHEYKYQCGICKKRFKLDHRYEYHMKKHEIKQQYICSSCGKVFRTHNGLRQHEILHGERKLQCKFCPSRFHRRDHLRIHEASHNKPARGDEQGTRFFSCRFCSTSAGDVPKFPNMRQLMRHYQDEHALERGNIPGSMKYSCDRCDRTFVNSTLLRHHHMWHAGLRPYNCSTCGAGFMVKERLRNHELTHTNERPFKCQLCGKGFRSRNCLKQHKLIHKDPSEYYKCSYCEKGFSRIDNLRTHVRVHTGEKPWKCLHCHKQFRLRSDCSKHIHVTHQVPQDEVLEHMETLIVDPSTSDLAVGEETVGTPSMEVADVAAVNAAVRGITSVTAMELLIEDGDLEECEEAL